MKTQFIMRRFQAWSMVAVFGLVVACGDAESEKDLGQTDIQQDEVDQDLGDDVGDDVGQDTPETTDDTGDLDQIAADDTSAPVKLEIVVGTPVEVDPQEILTDDIESSRSWDGNGTPYMAMSSCGDWGLLFREVVAPSGGLIGSALMFASQDKQGNILRTRVYTEGKTPQPLPFGWTLYYDDDCVARVVLFGKGAYWEWSNVVDDSGQTKDPVEANLNLQPLLGAVPESIDHLAAGVDSEYRPHLLFEATTPDKSIHTVHAWKDGNHWKSVKVDFGGPRFWLGLAFGNAGIELSSIRKGLHVVFTDENDDLYYQRFDDSQWLPKELVWASAGSGKTVPSASIALGAYDVPTIAFTVEDRSDAGDLIFLELRLGTLSNKVWSSATLVNKAEAFGANQMNRTGFAPQLRFDEKGRMHLVFMDKAYLTDKSGDKYEASGSIRYAYKRPDGWYYKTLLEQQAPQEINSFPRLSMLHPQVALSPDGADVVAGGMVFREAASGGRSAFSLMVVEAENQFAW